MRVPNQTQLSIRACHRFILVWRSSPPSRRPPPQESNRRAHPIPCTHKQSSTKRPPLSRASLVVHHSPTDISQPFSWWTYKKTGHHHSPVESPTDMGWRSTLVGPKPSHRSGRGQSDRFDHRLRETRNEGMVKAIRALLLVGRPSVDPQQKTGSSPIAGPNPLEALVVHFEVC